ncbi:MULTISPECIES: hypothetical protein [Massilia]|uniref:Uncharacterized protein n=1 Tax=Massilia aurea TaxID=373040 RepID=A0A422QRX9_9BURK|nr:MULTISPECIES: hypothetical protein [Massilia]MDY0962107.1 hypothetical protein [Massilia sp. CFBP9026]RNF32715.1 hypothetical protein NM04_00485 [Massilia aurea]
MTITQKITELPPAPDPAIDSPSEFSQKAANSVLAQRALPGELNNFAIQANAVAADVSAKSITASSAAQLATAAASDVVKLAGVNAWVSGATYQKNAAVISQLNFQTYRRRVAGAGTTDPANDSTNWTMLTGDGAFVPQPVAASSINLALGNYFTRTQSASQTYTFDNCPHDGYSFTLELTVTGGTATLPASVRTPDDMPYVLTVNKVHELMFVTSNRGARWRLAAATNYSV